MARVANLINLEDLIRPASGIGSRQDAEGTLVVKPYPGEV